MHKLTFEGLAAEVARTNSVLPEADWNEQDAVPRHACNEDVFPEPQTASVSQIVRRQMVDMKIPVARVCTRRLSSGRYATRVYGHDIGSIAEGLRTLHRTCVVEETVTFVNLISDGRV